MRPLRSNQTIEKRKKYQTTSQGELLTKDNQMRQLQCDYTKEKEKERLNNWFVNYLQLRTTKYGMS